VARNFKGIWVWAGTIMGHGFKHQYDVHGALKSGRSNNGIPFYEIDSVNIENRIRKASGAEKRTKYLGIETPANLIE